MPWPILRILTVRAICISGVAISKSYGYWSEANAPCASSGQDGGRRSTPQERRHFKVLVSATTRTFSTRGGNFGVDHCFSQLRLQLTELIHCFEQAIDLTLAHSFPKQGLYGFGAQQTRRVGLFGQLVVSGCLNLRISGGERPFAGLLAADLL